MGDGARPAKSSKCLLGLCFAAETHYPCEKRRATDQRPGASVLAFAPPSTRARRAAGMSAQRRDTATEDTAVKMGWVSNVKGVVSASDGKGFGNI